MVRQNECRNSTKTMSTAEAHVDEARGITRRVVNYWRGKCGDDVDVALYRASVWVGEDEHVLRTLWLKCRPVKFVKSHVMDKLRQADAWLKEASERERAILRETAETLERVGHPAARLARKAAEMAGEE